MEWNPVFTNSEYTVREIRTRSGAGVATAVLRRLAAGARRFGDEALAAGRRSRQRARLWRELQRLDDRQFRDIGRTRAELEAEAAKPFWRR
jgi:uncharacterized protein YjiS (DUF1127 family)